MAYASLLQEEGINSQFLIVMRPRRIEASFTVFSGSVYSKPFSFGYVYSVEEDGVVLTEAFATALSAGQWFYDYDNSILYLRTSDSSNPSTKTIVVTYEIFTGTFDAHWFRIPTDNTSREVYFEPIVQRSPGIKTSLSDSIFGYLPINSTQLILSNGSHSLEQHLYDSSFNRCQVLMYHWLGNLQIDNVKLIFDGICSSFTYDNKVTTFKLTDRQAIFDTDYRHVQGGSFFSKDFFVKLDPNFVARPIRAVFGVVDGFVPVNIDYVIDNPATSDNRLWVVTNGQTNLDDVVQTVSASPSSTTTRTYLDSVVGLRVGDRVWLDGTPDNYGEIEAVGANYIDHTSWTPAASPGDLIKRAFVGAVDIIQSQIKYKAFYGRDYHISYGLNMGTSGIVFETSLEANIGLPANLSSNDRVVCRVYGPSESGTVPGTPGDDPLTYNMSNGAKIFYKILNQVISSSDIDISTFDQLYLDRSDHIGIAIPDTSSGAFPSYKSIIEDILQTLLCRLFVNDNNKWAVSSVGPLSSASKSVDDTEILADSFKYEIDYSDLISTVIVEHAFKEVRVDSNFDAGYDATQVSSNFTEWLHKATKQKTFQTLHFVQSEAAALAQRLSYYLGDRIGRVSIDVKNRFFDSDIGDVHTVSRTRLPGLAYDGETEGSRDLVLLQSTKGLARVELEFEDQKGIEDNESSW